MILTDFTKDLDTAIGERIEYIFNSFQKVFPNVRYDERSSIVGIGEPDKYLLCYFIRTEDNNVLVKFKANNSPVALMESLSNIDGYIQSTITLFQKNNFFRKYRRRQATEKVCVPEKEVLLNLSDEEYEYLALLESVASNKGETLFESVASNRLANALNNAGIRTITDLTRWSYEAICSVKNFDKDCLNELKDLLVKLNDGLLPEKMVQTDYRFLFYRATKPKVQKLSDKKDVKIYLMSINYDENHFGKGTIGYVLCMRYKTQKITPKFSENSEQLKDLYLNNKDSFAILEEKTQNFLFQFIDDRIINDRNKDIVLSLLGQDGRKCTIETLGKKYEITREWVRQIFKKELKKLTFGLKLNSEEGIFRYNLRNELLSNFSNCSIDAFLLHLMIEKVYGLEKAFRQVILFEIECPEKMDENLETVYDSFLTKKKSKPKRSFSNSVIYNGFEIMISDDGDVLTDIDLLEKLKNARSEIAKRLGLPVFFVYNKTHLVLLATFKPINKDMYCSLSGFSEKTWDKYGSVMVNIIKEHLEYYNL